MPVILWQAWAFLAPAVQPHFERVVLVLVGLATALFVCGVAFMYVVVLPRALDFLTSYDDELYDIQIRASYYYTFAAMTLLAGGLAFLMPIFVLGLVRLRDLDERPAAPEPAHRLRGAPVLRDPPADRRPGVAGVRGRPARAPVRDVDLALGAHGAPLGSRLGRRVRRDRRSVTVLSADWVVPVEGEPIRDGAVEIDDRAARSPQSDGARSSATRCTTTRP